MQQTIHHSATPAQSADRKTAADRQTAGSLPLLFRRFTLALAAAFFVGSVQAGDADVLKINIKHLGENRFALDVTLEHHDTGWGHYANRWDVLNEAGETLGSRVLAHPHVNEQPFTRSLNLTIPAGVNSITVRANDSVHGANGKTITVPVPR